MLGQSARKLREQAFGFGVSPDGTRVAFTPARIKDATREIWIAENQGGNPQRVVALGENESVVAVSWSPDGQRLAYIKDQHAPKGELFFVEARDLKGANRTVVLSSAELSVAGLCWLADGRIVYSRKESPRSDDYNLWQIGINGRTGTVAREPKRITQWPGSYIWGLQASADGKRLVLLKTAFQTQIYLGELAAAGTRMHPARRLTNNEADDEPFAWTPDSQAVLFDSDRNGTRDIFKQGINEDADAAQRLTEGPQDVFGPHVTPDGAWILYIEIPEGAASGKERLMRIPISGGAPQPVLEMRRGWHMCARPPASFCVISEESQDAKQLTITAFDPLKGRGKVLLTLPTESGDDVGLSPDGHILAIARNNGPEIRILAISIGWL
jgi:Tol biopolymer transport system component